MTNRLLATPALLFALTVGAAACAHSSAKPLGAVDAYAAALDAHDYSRAYDLMSRKYRETHTREDFVRMMKESPAEVGETAVRLRAGHREVDVRASFVYDDLHDSLDLVQEDGTWKIASNPLDFYPQDTPQHALRSFVRAVQLERWDVVLRFIPNKWKEGMTEDKVKEQFRGEKKDEVSNMIRMLVGNLDNPIEQQGDEARMPYGDKFEVKFLREDGVWKIADPD